MIVEYIFTVPDAPWWIEEYVDDNKDAWWVEIEIEEEPAWWIEEV